jgi:hypothetical protein
MGAGIKRSEYWEARKVEELGSLSRRPTTPDVGGEIGAKFWMEIIEDDEE